MVGIGISYTSESNRKKGLEVAVDEKEDKEGVRACRGNSAVHHSKLSLLLASLIEAFQYFICDIFMGGLLDFRFYLMVYFRRFV